MYCGSMRTEANATAEAERQTGTSRLTACSRFASSDRYGMPYTGTGTDR